MEIIRVLPDIKNAKTPIELTKKRFACACCGNTWIELVGLIVWHKDENEDICLRIGMEPEICQPCKFRSRECPKCGSKDVYEIGFSEGFEKVSLSSKGVKKVSRR